MRTKNSLISIICALFLATTFACGGDESGGDDGTVVDEIPSFGVTGQVVDFETNQPVTGSATVTVEGIVPAPTVSTTGSDFTIEGIPPASVFHLLGGAGPDYVSTYSFAEVIDADQSDLVAPVVSKTYLDALATEFGVTPDDTKSILIGRVLDENGDPLPNIAAEDFDIPEQTLVMGPFFLDANRAPDVGLTETSASGYFVFFDLDPQPLAVAAAQGSAYQLSMAVSPAAADVVTLADVVARPGDQIELPVNVSFDNDVYPIFENRLCIVCHDKKAEGGKIGDLDLYEKKNINKVYEAITVDTSPLTGGSRIDLENPEQSLFLLKPGPPAGNHPNLTFSGLDDPDYVTILTWIAEGALRQPASN